MFLLCLIRVLYVNYILTAICENQTNKQPNKQALKQQHKENGILSSVLMNY